MDSPEKEPERIYTKHERNVLQAIESAKLLLRSRYPHISEIEPSDKDFRELAALYHSTSYVKYCAKFEIVFKIQP